MLCRIVPRDSIPADKIPVGNFVYASLRYDVVYNLDGALKMLENIFLFLFITIFHFVRAFPSGMLPVDIKTIGMILNNIKTFLFFFTIEIANNFDTNLFLVSLISLSLPIEKSHGQPDHFNSNSRHRNICRLSISIETGKFQRNWPQFGHV